MKNQSIHEPAGKMHTVLMPSLVAFIFLTAALSTWPASNERLEKLIEQFKGGACYWDQFGNKVGFFDRWTTRHYDENCKIAAAKFLGEMGPEANQAVPVLIAALENGPNDLDTGDGILLFRSTVAMALAKIGDPAAIPALVEKLKKSEPATLAAGASYPPGWQFATGVGQEAVVSALGMFGPQAKEAVPYLKDLLSGAQDERMREIIRQALRNIETE